MNKSRAEQIIVISLFVLLASTVGSHLVTGKDQKASKHYGRKITGGFLTILFASLAAEAAPELGALLALAAASYAFFNEGLPAINARFKQPAPEKEPNLRNPQERLPFTPGPEVTPEPLKESSPVSLKGTLA